MRYILIQISDKCSITELRSRIGPGIWTSTCGGAPQPGQVEKKTVRNGYAENTDLVIIEPRGWAPGPRGQAPGPRGRAPGPRGRAPFTNF